MFLVAVRQAAFYCYNAKLNAPFRYGLLVPEHLRFGEHIRCTAQYTLSHVLPPPIRFSLSNKYIIPHDKECTLKQAK